MVTDPISDLIVRLKNGSDARLPHVGVTYSKFAENVAQALKKAGYISGVDKKGGAFDRELVMALVFNGENEPRVHGVERISKPSLRIYQKFGDIRMYRSGFGNTFYSTPRGIMTDVEARKNKIGGEALFRIW